MSIYGSLYRVTSLDDFIGQHPIVDDVCAKIATCAEHGRPLPHMLLCGASHMGKRTLAGAIARGVLREGPRPPRSGSTGLAAAETSPALLAEVLLKTQGQGGDVVVIEDIDALRTPVAKALAVAMSDLAITIRSGTGAFASDIAVPLAPFSVVATTSRAARLNRVLRPWFVRYDLAPYRADEIACIMVRTARTVPAEVLDEIARHADGSPGNAMVLLRRVRDWLPDGPALDLAATQEALKALGVSRAGDALNEAERLEGMTGEEFEDFVAALYRDLGYVAELTGQTGDHGIDVMLRKGGSEWAVQCKRWSGSVGEPVVRDFLGAMTGARVRRGLIVTTGFFTSHAFAFAEKEGVELVDLDALMALVAQRGAPGKLGSRAPGPPGK